MPLWETDPSESGNQFPAAVLPPPAPGSTQRAGSQGDVWWKLETIEAPGLKFKNFSVTGQFPLNEEGITVRIGQVIPEASTFGVPYPFVQWVKGEVQSIQFDVFLFSRDKNEDIVAIFNDMLRLQEFVPELRRIPVCRFTFANAISVKCFVKGFGEAKFSRPKVDGTVRKIEFRMELVRYTPYEAKEVDTSKPPKFSRMQTASGESRMYEYLARREYGISRTLWGDKLRKLNRAYPFAVEDGGATKVPNGKLILGTKVMPEFHGFTLSDPEVSAMFISRVDVRRARILVI